MKSFFKLSSQNRDPQHTLQCPQNTLLTMSQLTYSQHLKSFHRLLKILTNEVIHALINYKHIQKCIYLRVFVTFLIGAGGCDLLVQADV